MPFDLETLVARRALSKGLLTQADCQRLENGGLSLHALLEEGLLKGPALSALLREVSDDIGDLRSRTTLGQQGSPGAQNPGQGDFSAPTVDLPATHFSAPPDAATLAPSAGGSLPLIDIPLPPVEKFERYENPEFVAEGGMGRVFRAYDRVLKRRVALKFLAGDSPDHLKRFLQEAQIQARVESPNICRIYEAGEVGGRPYIAMQYIEGETLDAAAGGMTLEQKLEVFRKVAEAVHAAHRMGLIHRDIKPSNIMVEASPEGQLEPYVMDFGLARELSGPSLTMTGVVMGTPSYMAPEQARGDVGHLDRRTDVYALGATLFEILCGKPPFEGASSLDILMKVLEQEPPALGKLVPSLPADLETIAAKCLEKEPQRRYESAKALAEDVGRYLDGDPIQARRASLPYLVSRKVRKHKAVVSVAGVAFLAVAILLTLWAHGRWEASRRTQLAQRFGQEVERIEAIMRIASLLPIHDTSRERTRVRIAMKGIHEDVVRLGRTANASGAYALGRGHLALGQTEEARKELEEAWKGGYRTPEAAYALGLAIGKLYQKELELLQGIRNKELREARRKEMETKWRDPAVSYLRQSTGAALDSPKYAEGLIAFYEKRYEPALQSARSAFAEVPWLYEAKVLEADILKAEATEMRDKGDFEGAKRGYALSEAALAEAAKIGQSDAAVYTTVCAAKSGQMYMSVYGTGEGVEALLASGTEAGEKALAVDRDDVDANECLSGLYRMGAEFAVRKGQDPSERVDKCLAYATRVTELAPGSADGWYEAAFPWQIRGRYLSQTGMDPVPSLDKAAENFRKAIEIEPDFLFAVNSLGVTYWYMGQYQQTHGKDPRPSLKAAAESFRKAAALKPDFTSAFVNLGGVLNDLGAYEAMHGMDPEATFAEAGRTFEAGLALNPKITDLLNNAGTNYLYRAECALNRGQDPRPLVEKALGLYGRALEVNPGYLTSLFNSADARRFTARYQIDTGADPSTTLAEARKIMDQVVASKAQMPEVWLEMALLSLLEADWQYWSGTAPSALERARGEVRKAAEIDAQQPAGYRLLANAELLDARWRLGRGESPAVSLDRAGQAAEKAVALDPGDAEGYRLLAEWHLRSAQARLPDPGSAQTHVARGLEKIGKSITINSLAADAQVCKGALCIEKAKLEGEGAARQEALKGAGAALRAALGINPLLKRECEPLLEECRRLGAPSSGAVPRG